MVIPMEEDDILLLQNDDVRIDELIVLQKVVEVIEQVQVGVVVDL
jgi:hypothetical protein